MGINSPVRVGAYVADPLPFRDNSRDGLIRGVVGWAAFEVRGTACLVVAARARSCLTKDGSPASNVPTLSDPAWGRSTTGCDLKSSGYDGGPGDSLDWSAEDLRSFSRPSLQDRVPTAALVEETAAAVAEPLWLTPEELAASLAVPVVAVPDPVDEIVVPDTEAPPVEVAPEEVAADEVVVDEVAAAMAAPSSVETWPDASDDETAVIVNDFAAFRAAFQPAVEPAGNSSADTVVLPRHRHRVAPKPKVAPAAARLRKPAIVGIAAGVCVLTAGGGTLAAITKTVTISVDGEDREVTTLAGSVEGALEAAGLTVDENDTLAPAGGSPISDGSRIALERGRPLTVTIDGEQRKVWTTAATVEEALAELGESATAYQLSADRSHRIPVSGLALTGRSLRTVDLVVGADKSLPASTTATTVGELLSERGIKLGKLDTVSPSVKTELQNGDAVTVTRKSVSRKTNRVAIAQPAATTVQDAKLNEGTTKVVQKGQAGTREVTVEITTVNGKASTKEVGNKVVTEAKPTITHVGTHVPKPSDSWSVPWDEMAFCESTNRWDANTGNGTYGGLQFMTSTWQMYGGGEFAERADLATKDQQIEVAERLYAAEGLAPWHCARLLGWGFGQYNG